MNAAKIFFISLFVCFSHQPVTAADFPDSHLDNQRQTYKQALSALRKGQRPRFNYLRAELKDYPLYPYLEYAAHASHLTLSKRKTIEQFLEDYDGQPVASRMRYRWLEYLRKRDRWQDFLKYTDAANGTTQQQCYYQLARYRNGQQAAAIKQAIKLWSVGKSQPKGCDKLFGVLIKKGHINEQVAWQRYSQAVLNHKYQLARYLKRFFVSEKYQTLANNYYQADRTPRTVLNAQLFKEHSPEVLQVIEHGLRHLAAKDAKKALGFWNLYHQTHQFTATSRRKIITSLVKGLYRQQQIAAADTLLTGSSGQADAALLEWRIREALSHNDWTETLRWIEQLPAEYQQDDRWLYWKTRAQLATGKVNNNDAQQRYLQLAKKRSFYGFLSAHWTNSDYQLQHQPIQVTPSAVTALDNTEAFTRIRELLFHNEMSNARREWTAATRNFSEQQWQTAAKWATQAQWPDRAISSMIKAAYWHDIDIRFPVPHSGDFAKNAKRTGVPKELLLSIARQESALNPDIQSPVGARGLMQLMPATAQQTARKHKIPYRKTADLYNPKINIQLGSRYYADMLSRFDNRILATAAYNAGPGRVNQWLKKSEGSRPFDVWIETIPFKETRGYVQNVLAFSIIYSHHLSIEPEFLTDNEFKKLL